MSPQESFNDLVLTIAKQIAEEAIRSVREDDRNVWLSQKELIKQKGFTHAYIKQMERFGLQGRRQGKQVMYCLADVNEVLHLMKG